MTLPSAPSALTPCEGCGVTQRICMPLEYEPWIRVWLRWVLVFSETSEPSMIFSRSTAAAWMLLARTPSRRSLKEEGLKRAGSTVWKVLIASMRPVSDEVVAMVLLMYICTIANWKGCRSSLCSLKVVTILSPQIISLMTMPGESATHSSRRLDLE